MYLFNRAKEGKWSAERDYTARHAIPINSFQSKYHPEHIKINNVYYILFKDGRLW
jgi:hypothetical protein